MSEYIGPPDPNRFQQRIAEATAKSKLAIQRMQSAMEKLSTLSSPEDRSTIAELMGATFFNARTMEDQAWVAALGLAGLDQERICQIWDVKDGISRLSRDTASNFRRLIDPPEQLA